MWLLKTKKEKFGFDCKIRKFEIYFLKIGHSPSSVHYRCLEAVCSLRKKKLPKTEIVESFWISQGIEIHFFQTQKLSVFLR